MNSDGSVALAFAGTFSSALAMGLALLNTEVLAALCCLAMTTHCTAEFMLRSQTGLDCE